MELLVVFLFCDGSMNVLTVDRTPSDDKLLIYVEYINNRAN